MCVAAAIAGAGVVGGVASGVIGADASKSAANTQASAQEQAAADQMQMFNTINGQEQPFMNAGYGATTSLQQLLGITPGTSSTGGLSNGYLNQTFNPSSITSSPGYQFEQTQGMDQLQNSAAATTGALSGAAQKELANFTTGTAEQYYNDYFNQFQTQQNNIFDRLSSIAGLGQSAAANVGNSGTQLGTGAAQATAAAGGSQAAGTIGAANAYTGGLSSVGNSLALSSILNANNGFSSSSIYNPSTYNAEAVNAANPNVYYNNGIN